MKPKMLITGGLPERGSYVRKKFLTAPEPMIDCGPLVTVTERYLELDGAWYKTTSLEPGKWRAVSKEDVLFALGRPGVRAWGIGDD